MKYSKEFKLEMIHKKRNGEKLPNPSNRKYERWQGLIRKWERIYESLGEQGLEHKQNKLKLDDKLNLMLRIDAGESITRVALSLGLGETVVSKWYKIYRQYGIDGLKSLKRGRKKKMRNPSNDLNKTELEKLREENEYLKAENEYLKKLRALIQKEEKDQPPDKK